MRRPKHVLVVVAVAAGVEGGDRTARLALNTIAGGHVGTVGGRIGISSDLGGVPR